ncbi:MAG: hypothetical protein Q4E50_00595 [Tissierellia bacterium]|nr:hypothetical protein [Tissierellia bacterium]
MKKIRNLIFNKIDENKADLLANNLISYFKSATKKQENLSEDFVDITNLFLFEHGLLENTGLKDYVLVDFLKTNAYLVKGIKLPTDIFSSSILELSYDDDLSISNLDANKFFDIFKEFVAINAISRSNPHLCNLVLEMTDKEMVDRKFFRILSYYSAVYCLHLRIDIENEKNEYRKMELNEKLDYMFDIYEDFTQTIPNWVKK